MTDELEIYRAGIRRFRIGGIAISVLPLVLALATMMTEDRTKGLPMFIMSLIALLLVLWATHCAETVVREMERK